MPSLVTAEWGVTRAALLIPRPLPTPAAVAAWRCPASDADASLAASTSPERPPAARAPPSAPAALAALRAVQGAVLAALVGAAGKGQKLALAPPPAVAAAPAAVDPPDDHPARLIDQHQCTVAFARGQERRVVLARARAGQECVAAAVLADPGPGPTVGRVLCAGATARCRVRARRPARTLAARGGAAAGGGAGSKPRREAPRAGARSREPLLTATGCWLSRMQALPPTRRPRWRAQRRRRG